MSTIDLVKRTFPFFLARFITYALFAIASLLFLGIMIGFGVLLAKIFDGSALGFLIVMVVAFVGVYGGLRFLERYFLYMIKVGHIAVVVELLRNEKVPEGKSQIAYGKEQVQKNFGSANVAFVMDKMIYGAVKQIQRWLLRVGDFLNFIPGASNVIQIISLILSVSLNYIDEAVLSYTILRRREKRDESVWKSAADGVVLYAQSWKNIIKTAAGSVVLIYAFSIGSFLVLVFPLMGLSKLIASDSNLGILLGFLSIVGAVIVTVTLKRGLIDPIVTIAMIRSYQNSIKGVEPKIDLQQKLLGVSSRFKQLFNKSEEDDDTKVVI